MQMLIRSYRRQAIAPGAPRLAEHILGRAAALQSVAVRRPTGNDVSGPLFWQERSALQSVAVRRSTGNDDSGPLFSPLFFSHSIPFHSIFSILRRDLFS